MCRRIRCEQCQKPSFAGCGRHVDQVLKDVPPEARCHCKQAVNDAAKPSESQPSAAQAAASPVVTPVFAQAPSERKPQSAPAPSKQSSPAPVYAASPSKPKASAPLCAAPSAPAPKSNHTSQASPFSSPFSSRPSRRVA
jgi:hypothetical protein